MINEYLEYLNNLYTNKPFYSFLFLDLLHAISLPKDLPKKFQLSWEEADYMKLNNETDPTPFFNLYRNCAYQLDSLVGIIIKDLEKRDLMKKTVLIITGDHGQEFNENKKNYWGHGSNFSKWQLQVPLIIVSPESEKKEFNHMTTHYDLVPTIMGEFLGAQNPTSDYSMGYSLYNTHSRYPHIVGDHVNYAFVFENIIVSTNHLGTLEVTDKQLNELPRSAINV